MRQVINDKVSDDFITFSVDLFVEINLARTFKTG